MRIGVSLFLIAIGAILTFAVSTRVSGLNIAVVGVILMLVGAVGLILYLTFRARRRRTDVIQQGEPTGYVEQPAQRVAQPRTRTTYYEPNDY